MEEKVKKSEENPLSHLEQNQGCWFSSVSNF